MNNAQAGTILIYESMYEVTGRNEGYYLKDFNNLMMKLRK